MDRITGSTPSMILASGSPRRLQLCRRIGLEPIVRVSDIPEEQRPQETPEEYACRLAGDKARAVVDSLEDDDSLPGWVLSADTIVVHRQEVLEKPADAADAKVMLRRLSGERHEVITAFCWVWRAPGEDAAQRVEAIRSVTSSVWLRALSDQTIANYVATGEPMDKAGSYGIQDVGGVLVRKNEGSYFAIVGLPVCEVMETLDDLGGLGSYPFAGGLE